MIWAGHVARMGEMRNADSCFGKKNYGNRPFERSKPTWEDNIEKDLNK